MKHNIRRIFCLFVCVLLISTFLSVTVSADINAVSFGAGIIISNILPGIF